MEPVTLVMTALAAGAGIGIKDTVSQAVKDVYAGLKSLVLRRVGDVPGAIVAVEQHEQDPATWQAPVVRALTVSGAIEDDEILALARRLLSLIRDENPSLAVSVTAVGKRSVAAQTIIGAVSTGDTASRPRSDG